MNKILYTAWRYIEYTERRLQWNRDKQSSDFLIIWWFAILSANSQGLLLQSQFKHSTVGWGCVNSDLALRLFLWLVAMQDITIDVFVSISSFRTFLSYSLLSTTCEFIWASTSAVSRTRNLFIIYRLILQCTGSVVARLRSSPYFIY